MTPRYELAAPAEGVSAGTDMALAVIASLYGRERARQIADYTEYQWHEDADRDPFVRFLSHGNKADSAALMAPR